MVDINTFLMILLCMLGSILLVVLIILSIKLIATVDRVNSMLDEVNVKIGKLDKLFKVVDLVTDNMAMISDKIVDGVSSVIRKIFNRKKERKDDEISE